MPETLLPCRPERLREQLLRSAFGVTALVAAATAGSASLQASCAPSNFGTGGPDNITCVAAGGNPAVVLGFSGDDIITNNGETITTGIFGGAGNDTLSQTSGSVNTGIFGSSGGDTILFSGGTANVGLSGDDDNDLVIMSGGVVNGFVAGGQGNDAITISGGSGLFIVTGSSGQDTLEVSGGEVDLGVFGGDDRDTITISGGNIDVGVNGDGGDDVILMSGGDVDVVNGGSGSDTVAITGGTIDGLLLLGVVGDDGNDTLSIGGTALVNGLITGGSGNDSLELTGNAYAALGMIGGAGDDTLFISGGTLDVGASGDGPLGPNGDDGNDVILMSGGQVNGALVGFGGNDTFDITGGTLEGAGGFAVDAGDGADTIAIGGTAQINDTVSGRSGSDSIVMSGGTVDSSIVGEDGDDYMELSGGLVTGDVYGNSGADTITLSGVSLDGTLGGDTGADTLELRGGTVAEILGGLGDDTITLQAGVLTGNAVGGSGADILKLTGSSLLGTMTGDTGSDTFIFGGGDAVAALGGLDDDTFFLFGGQIDTLSGDEGNDIFTLYAGQVTDIVLGGSGNDEVSLIDSATVDDISGGSGNDTFELTLATAVTGTVDGGEGDDVTTLRGAGAGGNFDGLVLSGIETLSGGGGSDDLISFLGVTGTLPEGFEGYETVILDSNTTLDVHNSASDSRDLGLNAAGPFSVGIGAGSLLIANGNSPGVLTLPGDLANAGGLDMRDGAADDRTVVTGNYAGDGGQLFVDAALDASNVADVLEIQGAVADVTVPHGFGLLAAGSTAVAVTDVGTGNGVLTGNGPGNGIAVIDVSANPAGTTPADFFLLGGPIQAGAVQYDLVLETDGIWYLQSSFLNQVFGYATAPSAALGMGQDYLGTLRQRVGTREQSWTGGATQSSDGTGVWLRGGGSSAQVNDANGFDYDQDHWFAQAGADFPLLVDPASGRLIGGLFAQYGTSNVDAFDDTGATVAKTKLDAWGGGLSLTWYGSPEGAAGQGFYADLLGQVSLYDADFKTTDSGQTGSTDGWGWGVSLEAGWGFTVADQVRLIPQAQLTYSRVSLDDFTDRDGIAVEFGSAESLEGRLGFAVDSGKLWRSGNLTFTASVIHEFLGESQLTVSGVNADSDQGGTAAQLGLGGTVSLLDDVSLYGNVDYRIPFDQGRESVQAQIGIRLSW